MGTDDVLCIVVNPHVLEQCLQAVLSRRGVPCLMCG